MTTRERLDELKKKLRDEDDAAVTQGLARQKGKKLLQRFDALTGQWFRSWDEHLGSLVASKQMMTPEQQRQFESLLKSFKSSAMDLHVFIHSCRVEFQKKA